MAISDKIESIENHLKKDYQSIANLGADLTNVDKNIENISSLLDNVYDVLPKTSFQEGTSVTIENGLKGKIDFDDGKVGFGQASQESTQGYQLFNPTETWSNFNGITTTITNQVMKWNGTVTTNGSKKVANISMPSGTYTISFKTISGSHISGKNIWLDFLNGTTKIGGTNFWQDGNKQVTLNGDVNIVNFGFDSGDVFNNYSFIVMIESGTTAHDCEKYTGGYASPNPSYPQEVKVVRGKNLLDMSIFEYHYTLDSNGLPAYINSQNRTTNTTPIDVSYLDNVTLSWTNNTGHTVLFIYSTIDKNGALLKRIAGNDNGATIDVSNAKDLYICFYDNAQIGDSGITNIQLEKGSQATSYLPYNTLEVKVQNKNLCTEMEQGDVSTSTGEASSYQPTTSGFIRSKDYIPVKPSEVITVSYKNTATSSSQIVIFEYNASKTYIGFYYSNASTYTRTLGNETAYIKIRLQDTTNTLSNNTEIQVEYGNTKTSYVEHQEQTYQLSLGEYEFAKIGNYVDTIEYDVDNDKVYLNKRIIKRIITSSYLDGLYAFGLQSINSYGIANFLLQVGMEYIYPSDINGLCNYLSPQVSLIANEQNEGILYQPRNEYIRISQDRAKTKEEFKTYVDNLNANGNPLAIYRALNEVVKEEITGTLKEQIKDIYNLMSYTGTTILESNGDLPMIIKVRALKGE